MPFNILELTPNAMPLWRTDTDHSSSISIVLVLQSPDLMHSDIFYLHFSGEKYFWTKVYHHTPRVYPMS